MRKAPAGAWAILTGVAGLTPALTDAENGILNPLVINALRSFSGRGSAAWGALAGTDSLDSEWKYVNVRRLALFLEESLDRGTRWVPFERNGEPLWAELRLHVGSFMRQLFRAGPFQGTTEGEAYLVKCDAQTTTQTDIAAGVVNLSVGFAAVKSAEFVILRFVLHTAAIPDY